MKRRITKTGINLSYSLSWTLTVVIATVCFLSCACRNKSEATAPAEISQAASSSPSQVSNVSQFVPQSELESTYAQIVSTVQSQPGYSHYADFLRNGKYVSNFMRMDILKYVVVIPSDESLKALGNERFTQLIYPELFTQDNLNFFNQHTAFGANAAAGGNAFRTFSNRMINLDFDKNELYSGNFRTKITHHEAVSPAVQLVFVNDLIN